MGGPTCRSAPDPAATALGLEKGAGPPEWIVQTRAKSGRSGTREICRALELRPQPMRQILSGK